MPLILGANSITGGYEVDNSLRFDDGSSDYLDSNNCKCNRDGRQIYNTLFGLKRSTFRYSGHKKFTIITYSTDSEFTFRF
jgi:hypothetical protein